MKISAGPFVFRALLEEKLAPKTCAAFLQLLPYRQKLIHARWSGEACWIPLGEFKLGVGPENAISTPAPGQILFYPGGLSETEILLPYGKAAFACKDGPLAGNPFLTIVEGAGSLPDLGRLVLWKGAQDICFE
ncbi:MAG: DUF3830 family protein [Planctomycetes bacterium]|nr:DUF3830 family protein [Planctomycetota bacterium]